MVDVKQETRALDLTKCVFSGEGGRAFQFNGISGRAVTGASENPHGDVALISVDGAHGAVLDRVSHRTYVVKHGSGVFTIAGVDREVKENDVVIVPPNTAYDFRGKMELTAFFTPPFNFENEVAIGPSGA